MAKAAPFSSRDDFKRL